MSAHILIKKITSICHLMAVGIQWQTTLITLTASNINSCCIRKRDHHCVYLKRVKSFTAAGVKSACIRRKESPQTQRAHPGFHVWSHIKTLSTSVLQQLLRGAISPVWHLWIRALCVEIIQIRLFTFPWSGHIINPLRPEKWCICHRGARCSVRRTAWGR